MVVWGLGRAISPATRLARTLLRALLWIKDDFPGRSAKQHLQTVQHVSAQDTFVSSKIGLEPTWVVRTIKMSLSL